MLICLSCDHRVWQLSDSWERHIRMGCLNCADINHGYTEETFTVFLFGLMV